jgi:hypothetical protein
MSVAENEVDRIYAALGDALADADRQGEAEPFLARLVLLLALDGPDADRVLSRIADARTTPADDAPPTVAAGR